MKLLNIIRSPHPTSFILGFMAALLLSVVLTLFYCSNIVAVEYTKPCRSCGGTMEGYESFVDWYKQEICHTCGEVITYEYQD